MYSYKPINIARKIIAEHLINKPRRAKSTIFLFTLSGVCNEIPMTDSELERIKVLILEMINNSY